MRSSILIPAALLALTASAAPAPQVDYTKIDYPDGTGEDLPYYPPPPGGWESVYYPPGTGSDPAACPKPYDPVFTSSFDVIAIGSEVRNGTVSVPGPADAMGYFHFRLNSNTDTICFNITLVNVVGDYKSPARTATHVHSAARGASGPPRIAFPNPVGDDKLRVSYGCLTAPFVTGINTTGTAPVTDSGSASGFTLKAIEANPAGFFADSHTKLFTLGVVRGQFA